MSGDASPSPPVRSSTLRDRVLYHLRLDLLALRDRVLYLVQTHTLAPFFCVSWPAKTTLAGHMGELAILPLEEGLLIAMPVWEAQASRLARARLPLTLSSFQTTSMGSAGP